MKKIKRIAVLTFRLMLCAFFTSYMKALGYSYLASFGMTVFLVAAVECAGVLLWRIIIHDDSSGKSNFGGRPMD